MAKIANELNKQMNMEGVKEQAQQCKAIYDKLMEMDGGHIWQRKWDQLVKFCSRSNENGEIEFYYKPSEIGEIFLKGLAADKHQDGEQKVRVLCFCDTEDDYKGVLLVTGIDADLKAKRKDIEDAIRPAFFDEYMADAGVDEDEDLFQQVMEKLASGEDAEFHEYEIFWDTTVIV